MNRDSYSPTTADKFEDDDIRTTKRRDALPLPVSNFRVFIDKEEIGVVSVSPLHDLIEGDADPNARQSVMLRRATTQDRRFFEWYREAAKRKSRERSVSIVQLDDANGKAVNIWRLEQARPVRWTGPGFDALSSEIAMEELEVAYKSIAWRSRL